MPGPTLTVAISTLGSRVSKLTTDGLQAQENTSFLIFVQNHTDEQIINARDTLARSDVSIISLDSRGVAYSRNAAIASCKSDVLLFGDDDICFNNRVFEHTVQTFNDFPEIDFACFRLTDCERNNLKQCPAPQAIVNKRNCGRVGTPEIAIRSQHFRDAGIKFDTNFGAGSQHKTGDEYIFLCDALRAGLRGMHFDLSIGSHPGEGSGHVWGKQSFITRELVLRRALRPWSWPYRVGYAAKHRSKFPDWKTYLRIIRP